MADLYGRSFGEEATRLFLDGLSDLEPDQVVLAIKQYSRLESSKSFPSIGQIRALVVPAESEDSLAREVAELIPKAIRRFGYTNPDKAKEYLGELAWKVVESSGGWRVLCELTNEEDLPTLKSQWREYAKVLRNRAKNGFLDNKPRLVDDSITAIPRLGHLFREIP